jgi:glycosyltransferase involved in cell wall biosynthesis
MPKISVVVPTYNAQSHIVETVESLLRQDADFEILVLDDASRDETLSLVQRLNDERIRVFPLQHNQGRPANANRAFDLCRGDYIARIDHDDLAEPGRLRMQAEFLDANPGVTVVGSQLRLFGQQDSVSDFPLDDASIKGRFLLGAAYLANPSTMFRREFIQKHAIRYDPNLDIVDDLGFWFDCMIHGARFANLPEPLTAYRIHSSMTSLNLNAAKLYKAKVRLYTRMFQAFYPSLTAHDIRHMCKLHEHPRRPDEDFNSLLELHRSVGVAISDIDMSWGASRTELEGRLLGMLSDFVDARDASYPRSAEQVAQCNEAIWEGIRSNPRANRPTA